MLRVVKLLLINLTIIIFLGMLVELVARFFYPELVNDYHSESITRGVCSHRADFKGTSVRVPFDGYDVEKLSDLIVILGDSVSNGYGLDYDDIYWTKFQRFMDCVCISPPSVICLGHLGNNLQDAARDLSEFIATKQTQRISSIIYQFNYNDITPQTRQVLQAMTPTGGISFAKWRYKWLNRLVSLRLAQHYAAKLLAARHSGCEKNAGHALGLYSYTYGSKALKYESDELWSKFETDLANLKATSNSLDSKLYVLISPLVYHVDPQGMHPFYNTLGIEWSCATIDPSKRLKELCSTLGITVIDPTPYVREGFDRRMKGNNFTFFFFPTDDNHFNEVTSTYVAEAMSRTILMTDPPPGLRCGAQLMDADRKK